MEKIASVTGLLDGELFVVKSIKGYWIGIKYGDESLSAVEINHDDFIEFIKTIVRKERI